MDFFSGMIECRSFVCLFFLRSSLGKGRVSAICGSLYNRRVIHSKADLLDASACVSLA